MGEYESFLKAMRIAACCIRTVQKSFPKVLYQLEGLIQTALEAVLPIPRLRKFFDDNISSDKKPYYNILQHCSALMIGDTM